DTSTDTREQKGQWNRHWTKSPGSLPELETLVLIDYTHDALKNRLPITLSKGQCCTTPATDTAPYPKPGVLGAASDADAAVTGPQKTPTVDHAQMDSGADWSAYQGWQVAGFPEATFCRGKQIVKDYKFVGENGWGRWLPREKAGALP